MRLKPSIAYQLAAVLLGGSWQIDDLVERGGELFEKRPRWLRPLAGRIAETFGRLPRPRIAVLAAFIASDAGFQRYEQYWRGWPLEISNWPLRPAAMSPCAGRPATWNVPTLPTPGALAQWLETTPRQLDWFADRQGRERDLPAGPLRHYHYRWVPKRAGGVRLIEIPKSRLRAIQRRVLHGILEHIPPHDAAHGFRSGRSIKTFVAPHVGQCVVLRMDLQDFFMSIAAARVCSLFRTAGYPEAVASLLAGLCTNSLPAVAWEDEAYQLAAGNHRRQESLHWPHVPQGAPTSPAVANLCAYRLDCRLSALARSMEAQYTRYADDLVFSGGQDFQRAIKRFHLHVAAIALEEGFRVHARKTRIMRRSVRQQAAGVVINSRPCIRRSDYDRLKATLHNCVHHGPATQNRQSVRDFKSHLAGRVSYVEMLHPARGKRLRAIFERIDW
ncbi:MAG TPA: reverse transcriptase domain-containing protein [Pirellulales bacterium]|jgi:hypothetical protein|nr:reverse transcriptase domain-containing protein [Pirellulales bacterium]